MFLQNIEGTAKPVAHPKSLFADSIDLFRRGRLLMFFFPFARFGFFFFLLLFRRLGFSSRVKFTERLIPIITRIRISRTLLIGLGHGETDRLVRLARAVVTEGD